MIRPRGMAPISVTINNFNVCKNPVLSALTTTGNCFANNSILCSSVKKEKECGTPHS